MLNVEEQTARIEQLYRQLTGNEPTRSDRPVAPIPPDANPEQYVSENLQKLQATLQTLAQGPQSAMLAALAGPTVPTVPPRLTVFESEQEWRCAVELPGVKKDDVQVQITQGVLRVHANRNWPGLNGEPQRPQYAESLPCRFERAIPLPPFARCESADARLDNGVLVVKCAKDPSAVRRDLKVEVA